MTGKLLHRTCFKCARCNQQLSIASYYETEEGAYCCELCPDEELTQSEVAEANKKVVREHMDSDEDSLPESQRPNVTIGKKEWSEAKRSAEREH